MKNKTLFILFSILCLNSSYSQNDSISVVSKGRLHVQKQCDSLFQIRNTLQDGKHTIYYDVNNEYIAKTINLKKGNIDGLYRHYSPQGYLDMGHYKKDSLWTFRSDRYQDSNKFKIGNWFYMLGCQITLPIEKHAYDYDSDSVYTEIFLFVNDQISNLTKYHKRLGIIHEASYYFNGIKAKEFTLNNNTELTQHFDTLGNLILIEIIDSKKEYKIGLNDKSMKFFSRYNETGNYITINDKFNNEWIDLVFNKDGSLKNMYSFDKNSAKIEIDYGFKKTKIIKKKTKKIL